MNAEVISIGDEITSGQLLDTNGQWLSARLAELGIRVLFHTSVGDDLEAQADVFRTAIGRADVVVVTGGLGPTADDLTRDALATATGRPLQQNDHALRHIIAIFARRKMQMPDSNRLQAMFPRGSRVVDNPHGTAPGIEMKIDRSEIISDATGTCHLFALPGVPAEMREMWEASVSGAIRNAGSGVGGVILHKKINCFGAGESRIEEMLADLIRRGRQPSVGITASRTTISLRITAQGVSESECFADIESTRKIIHQRLGDLVFAEDDEQLQDVIVQLLRQRGETLATAEWGTDGLAAQWLLEANENDRIDEEGKPFLGGVAGRDEAVLAALDMSSDILPNRIDDVAADEETSKKLVRQMAVACRRRFASHYGLAIGPLVSINANDTSTQVFAALATPQKVIIKNLPYAAHPDLRKTFFAKHALNMVRLTLLGKDVF